MEPEGEASNLPLFITFKAMAKSRAHAFRLWCFIVPITSINKVYSAYLVLPDVLPLSFLRIKQDCFSLF